jgi:hypothetical protein
MHKVLNGQETNLVAYYRFDHIGGAALDDLTTNDCDGTVVNGPLWVASTIPCANLIAARANLRGAWSAQTASLASDRFSVSNAVVAGTDFAVFGHDNATDGQTNAVDIPVGVDWRVERRWQAELVGGISGNIRFDTAGLADLGDGMRLCLLADADGVFSNGTVVNGSFSSPVFTAAGQPLASGAYYTLGKLGAFPGVTTAPITSITPTNAVCGGEVTNQGASAVTARGVCWNTTGSPTIADSHTTDGSGLGVFSSALTNLTAGQTYYVRAYAANASGTGYGQERSFVAPMIPPGNALDFDGANDYVRIADADVLDLTNNYTLEAWFKADSFNWIGGLVGKYHTAGANGYFLRLGKTAPYNSLNFDNMDCVTNLLQSNCWYHVAAVNSNGTRRLWLNGVEQTLSGSPQAVQANTNVLTIGVDYLASPRYFNGRIDEVRVWNVVRSEPDIRDAMHRTLTGNEPGLVAYYRCDHISGTTLADLTPNANTGTLINGPVWTNSTFPCANVIADRSNIRGVWIARTNSLASDRFSVSNAAVEATDFAVFGHDTATDGLKNSNDVPATIGWRLERVWQTELSGAVSSDIRFDASGLPDLGDGSDLCFLVDADGVFSNAAVVGGSFSSPILVVAGQTLSNGACYTLAKLTALATVTTAPVSNITHNAAQCGGNVSDEGGAAVTARGVCWNTAGSPTTADSRTLDGSGAGTFASVLRGLTPATQHYARAYAINAVGTAYGEERAFTTLAAPYRGALDFDGANDYVGIADADALDMTNNYTLEAWINVDTFNWLGGIISKYQTGLDTGYLLRLCVVPPFTGLDFDQMSTATGVLTANRWYHVAAVNSNGTRRLWLNGVEQPLSGIPVDVQANTNVLTIGVDYLASPRYFDGRLDEVRIWNVVRSEAEIQDNMHKQLTGTESGLVAYYTFNTNSGTVLPDLTTSGLDGTLINGPVWTDGTFPCADAIADRANLRGTWLARTNSLASSILSVSNVSVSADNFRVFGHDGAALTNDASDKPAGVAWRLNRAWQVEGTGAMTGTLVFNCMGITNLIQNTARLRLLADADGVFADATPVAGAFDVPSFEFRVPSSLPPLGYYALGEYGTRTITATAGPHGSINPSNAVAVTYGGSTNFAIAPATYWHVGDVATNGASVGAVTAFTWSNVVADGTINATFAANLASNGTPHWWLAQYDLTNGGWTFNQAETNNPDHDPHTSGQEYIADTDPTNAASYFHIAAVSNLPPVTVFFQSSSNRWYTMIGCSNLVSGVWTNVPGAGPRGGSGGPDSTTDTNAPPKGPFYRLKVQLP